MMLGTTALRREYAPACSPHGSLYLEAYAALDVCLELHQYAPRRQDTGAFSCRAITGGTGYSLHSYGPGDHFVFWNGLSIATSLAVDINWQSNPYGPNLHTDMPRAMVDDILAIRTMDGDQLWGWGGNYRTNKDAMHFEIVCTAASLRSGINAHTLPGPIAPPVPPPAPKEWTDMATQAEVEAAAYKGAKKAIDEYDNAKAAPRYRNVRAWHQLTLELIGSDHAVTAAEILARWKRLGGQA